MKSFLINHFCRNLYLIASVAVIFIPETKLHAESTAKIINGQLEIAKQPDNDAGLPNRNLVFYGLVMDKDSNVVADASIRASILVMKPGESTHSQASLLLSGNDGRFSIEAKWGQQIILKVAKSNYISTPWQTFRYGDIGGLEPRYYPDPNNPAIFTLYSKVNSKTNLPLFSFSKVFGLPHDGSPVRIDLTTGKIVLAGGDLIVSANCPEPYTNLKKFPWELSVSVVDGGLIEAYPLNGRIENMQEAPANGYSAGLDVKYDANSPDYRRQLDRLYYISSRNGQIYSKVRINMTTSWDERGVPFGIEAYVNVGGLRNLQTISQ